MPTSEDLYLDLMARVLTRYGFEDGSASIDGIRVDDAIQRMDEPERRTIREQGRDWPVLAETMVGLQRLRGLRACVESVLTDGVPGDFLEAGVWRGGAAIYMRAVLVVHGAGDRIVWLADSFQGLPPPRPQHLPDAASNFHTFPELAVDIDTVRANFARYDLLDDNVRFLVGWFEDTLPDAPVEKLALLRVDGDLYGSTWDVLSNLEPRVQPGGYVLVDDYHQVGPCRLAVDEYRIAHGITAPIIDMDWCGVYWRKP